MQYTLLFMKPMKSERPVTQKVMRGYTNGVIPFALQRQGTRITFYPATVVPNPLTKSFLDSRNSPRLYEFVQTRHASSWNKLFSTWGKSSSKNQKDEGLYDIKPIVNSLVQVKEGLDVAIREPMSKVLREHNLAAHELNAAAKNYKWLILQRSDIEKQRKVLNKLEQMKRFYERFCNSREFLDMEKTLGMYADKVMGSSKAIREQIRLIENIKKENEEKARCLDMTKAHEKIKADGMKQIILLNSMAISVLTNYKLLLDNLPDRIQTAQETVRGFKSAVESNRDILVTGCNMMRLLGDLQRGMKVIDGLVQMDVLRKDIEQCRDAISEVVVIFSEGINEQLKRKLDQIGESESIETSRENVGAGVFPIGKPV